MVSTSVIATKLFIPQVRTERVSRSRLVHMLNEGMNRKLTIVTAPAGYGKTTLLSEWVKQCRIPVAWISLDESDNDEDRLITYLITAIQAISEGSRMGEISAAVRHSPQPPPIQTVMTAMINEMADYGLDFALVLDDYQTINIQPIHDLVAFMLRYLPANVHLVIASRAVPPLALARYRVRDELTELTASDLKFTTDEVRIFLTDVMGLNLSRKDLGELESRTEGWVASLQLAALSLKGRDDSGALIAQLTGAHRFILDYLAEEVVDDQPKEVRDFLLRTSMLENLSASLCDEVTGLQNSQDILVLLEAENLFTSALDPERRWFRYHKLFKDYLSQRLAEVQPDRSTLHLKAARWYQKEGHSAEAIEHYLYAGNYNLAADVIEHVTMEMMSRGELTTTARWIGKLPDELVWKRPRLALAHEWAHLVRNPILFWSTTEERMNRLAKTFDIPLDSLVESLEDYQLTVEERNLMCEFAIMQAFVSRQAGDLERAVSLFHTAVKQLADDALIMKALGMAGLGSVYGRLSAFRQAEQALGEAVEISYQAGSIFFVVVCSGFQGQAMVLQGEMAEAKRIYQRGIDLLTDNLGPSAPLSGHIYAGFGDIFREQNDLDRSLEYVLQGIDRGQRVRDVDALREGYVTLARVRRAMGDVGGSRRAIESARQVINEIQNQECKNELDSWEARLELMMGDRETARRWADNRGFPVIAFEEDSPNLPTTNESTTYARLLIDETKPAEALRLLQYIQSKLENTERKHELIEILVLTALTYQTSGKRDDAMRALGRALLLGEPAGYVRMFLNEGPPMAALLRTSGAHGHSPEYVKRLLTAFGTETLQGAAMDPLSERELEVLDLIDKGFTNREIAEELVIGLSTVKTHINRIYSKLDVANRTQAVIRAREMGLV